MARIARLNIADMPQHIVRRGNCQQATFFVDDDYTVYLDKPRQYASKFKVSVHALMLMANHVHHLATPLTKPAPLSLCSLLAGIMCFISATHMQ